MSDFGLLIKACLNISPSSCYLTSITWHIIHIIHGIYIYGDNYVNISYYIATPLFCDCFECLWIAVEYISLTVIPIQHHAECGQLKSNQIPSCKFRRSLFFWILNPEWHIYCDSNNTTWNQKETFDLNTKQYKFIWLHPSIYSKNILLIKYIEF